MLEVLAGVFQNDCHDIANTVERAVATESMVDH